MINVLLNLYNFDEKWCFDTLKNVIKDHHKVVIVPFSFHDQWMRNDSEWQNAYNSFNGKYYKDIILPFLAYGIVEENIEWVNYFTDTKESAKKKIKDSNILFFTGGLPDRMMFRLEQFDLVEEIENYEGVVIGSSAGAMIQIAEYHITPDKDYTSFSYNKGLSLIKSFDIEVHYEETNIQKESIGKVLNEKMDTVYAMKNTGGILIDGNEITLLGDVTKFNR